VVVGIVTEDKNSTYRNKYIRKVQNSKIFHCDEVDYMSDEYPLIGMRDGSGEDEGISSIEDSRILNILFSDIVIDESEDEYDRDELERESSDRYGESHSWVVWQLQTEVFSENRRISIFIYRFIEILSHSHISIAISLESTIGILNYRGRASIAFIMPYKIIHIRLSSKVKKHKK
jgi:hypothetical protein